MADAPPPVLGGAVVLGSVLVAAAAATSDALRARWRSRRARRKRPAHRHRGYGGWAVGDPRLAVQVASALTLLRRSGADPAPEVETVLAGYDRVVLRLSRPAPAGLPSPWRAETGDPGLSWMVDAADLPPGEPDPGPCPTLVPVGSSDGWTILLHLAQAPGPIAVTGHDRGTGRFLAALAAGLATAPWSRRVRVVDGAAAVEALAQVDQPAVDGPSVLLLPRPPAEAEVRAAGRAGTGDHRVTLVCRGATGWPGWTVEVGRGGRLRLPPRGLVATPLAPADPGTVDVPASPAPGPAGAAAPAEPSVPEPAMPPLTRPILTDQARDRWWPAAVEARLLGPVEIRAPGHLDEEDRDRLTELVLLAALEPDGLPAATASGVLAGADPAATLRHLHDWLGSEERGLPRLRVHDGRWRLSLEVRVDWRVFRALTNAPDPGNERPRLATALAMIRGPLCAGARLGPAGSRLVRRRTAEVRSVVLRAVQRDAELALAAGDPVRAEWALRQGLALLPDWEDLWRALLLFQREHDPGGIDATVDEMVAAVTADRGPGRLSPATRRLLARLAPAKARR